MQTKAKVCRLHSSEVQRERDQKDNRIRAELWKVQKALTEVIQKIS